MQLRYETVLAGLDRLDDVCEMRLKESTPETWFIALQHLSDEVVQAGFIYLIREVTSEYNRKPRPGDIVSYARRLNTSSNGEAWEQVYRAANARAISELCEDDIPDPAVRQALNRIGGLKEIALCDNDRLSTIRAQFNRVYTQEIEAMADRDIAALAGAQVKSNLLPFRAIGDGQNG